MGLYYAPDDPGPREALAGALAARLTGLEQVLHSDPTLGAVFTQAGLQISTDLTGDGSGLTALNASELDSGTIPVARYGAAAGTATANQPAVLGAAKNLDVLQLSTVQVGSSDTTLTRGAAGVVTSNATFAGATSASAATVQSPGNLTIAVAGLRNVRVTASSAVTGAIMAAGSANGQEVLVKNEGTAGNTITFDASELTSRVLGGSSVVIDGGETLRLVWDSGVSRWRPFGTG